MRFRDFFLCEEQSPANFCYMLYLEQPYIQQVAELQKKLKVKADEFVTSDQFHCTIRYCKLSAGQTSLQFLEWLTEQELPEINAFTSKFSMFNEGSLVMELESPEMHEWFNKINTYMTNLGYLPSDFQTFKPHVSLAYGTTTASPVFDTKQHHIKLKFNRHIVTNNHKEVIFEERSKPKVLIPTDQLCAKQK